MARVNKPKISENKVKEIHFATDLSVYSHDELHTADQWVKDFALTSLRLRMPLTSKVISNYVLLMARSNYGSVETDQFLTALNCYPGWMKDAVAKHKTR